MLLTALSAMVVMFSGLFSQLLPATCIIHRVAFEEVSRHLRAGTWSVLSRMNPGAKNRAWCTAGPQRVAAGGVNSAQLGAWVGGEFVGKFGCPGLTLRLLKISFVRMVPSWPNVEEGTVSGMGELSWCWNTRDRKSVV